MDVIALAEAGIDHAVAPLGTAITEAQLEALWKIAPEPVIALDGDGAGLAAAQRLIDLALPHLGADAVAALRGDAAAGRTRTISCATAARRRWRRCSPARSRSSTCSGRARPRARCSTAPSAAPRSTRGCAPISPASPTPRCAGTGSARSARAAPRSSRPRRAPSGRRTRRGPRGRVAAAMPRGRGPVLPAVPTPAARASLLAAPGDAAETEARIRESAILAGCLNHPEAAHGAEERLERLSFRCRDLGIIRDALLSALSESLHEPHTRDSLGKAMHARLGSDPLAGPDGDWPCPCQPPPRAAARNREAARRAIDEEITRHAAVTGRREELREAMDEIAGARRRGADRPAAARRRRRSRREHPARSPTSQIRTRREHKDFISFFADVEAQQAARKPRRR